MRLGGERDQLIISSQEAVGSTASADNQSSFVREATRPYDASVPLHIVPLGQMSRTFLIVQVGNELQVIDQHTAHERVLFERLWRGWQGRSLPSQPLLLPEPLELPIQQALILQRHMAGLERLGLLIEPFGPSSFLIRSLPVMLGHTDLAALVQDLIEDLEQWDSISSLESEGEAYSGVASLPRSGARRQVNGAPRDRAIGTGLGGGRPHHDLSAWPPSCLPFIRR